MTTAYRAPMRVVPARVDAEIEDVGAASCYKVAPMSAPLVAVITGASSGIGEATARRLAREPEARLVLVARREELLRGLAETLPPACSWLALDLTDEDAPARVLAHVRERYDGRLTLLVNNAGAAWRAPFAEGGYANVWRTMTLNFDAPVRLTEALLPLLRECAPSAIVNVSSTAGRVSRPGTGAYAASKFALTGWSDALYAEEHAHGVHVGTVFPGFIATEGFPARELLARPQTAWIVSTPDRVAEAIVEVGLGRRAERYVPRPYFLAAAARLLLPGLVRRTLTRGGAAILTTTTGAEAEVPTP
jgi:short-subunit dehydrogenase